MQRLAEAVEAAKRALSEAETATIGLPFWGTEGSALHAAVTRRQFEAATAALRARLWPPLDRLGCEACLQWAERCGRRNSLPSSRIILSPVRCQSIIGMPIVVQRGCG